MDIPDERDIPEAFKLELYPVPADGNLEVRYEVTRTGPVTIVMYDMQGRKVQESARTIAAPGAHHERIVTAGLPAGMYMVVVQCAEGVVWRKGIVR